MSKSPLLGDVAVQCHPHEIYYFENGKSNNTCFLKLSISLESTTDLVRFSKSKYVRNLNAYLFRMSKSFFKIT